MVCWGREEVSGIETMVAFGKCSAPAQTYMTAASTTKRMTTNRATHTATISVVFASPLWVL